MNRSFRHRAVALAVVLLAGTVVLAWASPASALHALGSQATLGPGAPGAISATCPAPHEIGDAPTAEQIGSAADPVTVDVAGGTVTATQIQCAATGASSAAQVRGTYAIGTSTGSFYLQCGAAGGTAAAQSGPTPVVQEVTNNGTVTRTLTIGGVAIAQVICGPAAAYPLAVDVGAVSEGGPDLATQAATSAESSGTGGTWLFVVGAAALFIVVGQLAIGRRIGRNKPATD